MLAVWLFSSAAPAQRLPLPPVPPAAAPKPRPARPPAPAAPAAPSDGLATGGWTAQADPLPAPDLPALPRRLLPPTPIIGVLAVPDVMRASLAVHQAQRVLGARQEKLREDAEAEQAAWHAMRQALEDQRATLPADRLRVRARELQDRVAAGQRRLQERARALERANQAVLGRVQQTLVAVIRQVAESRGMNLVLHRGEVALSVEGLDITEQVAEQMNEALPSIAVPPGEAPPVAARVRPNRASVRQPAAPPARR